MADTRRTLEEGAVCLSLGVAGMRDRAAPVSTRNVKPLPLSSTEKQVFIPPGGGDRATGKS